MSQFAVSGRYQTRSGYQTFTKTVTAPNAEVARERVYSRLGSEHGLKRAQVELADVEEAGDAEEVAA
ncbi:MAG: 50S ribosomal protein L18Ae [Haloferacaceae archaeon]